MIDENSTGLDSLMSDDDFDDLDSMELLLKGDSDDLSPVDADTQVNSTEHNANKHDETAGRKKDKPSSKAPKKKPSKKRGDSNVFDMEASARSIVLNISDDLFDRINKRKIKNVTLSRAIKEIVSDFVKDPKWCDKLFKSLKTERFESLERGAPKNKAGYVNVYSPRLKQVAGQLSEKLNIPEAHIVVVMIELQLRKDGDSKDIDLSEFKGSLEL